MTANMGKAKKVGIGASVAAAVFVVLIVIGASTAQKSDNSFSSGTSSNSVLSVTNDNSTTASISTNQEQEQQSITTDSYSDITTQNKGKSFVPTKQTRQIIAETVRVDAGGYVVYPFTSPKDGTRMELTGVFITYGGDEIKVFVADETLFNQWKEGKRVFFTGNVYYSSGERYVTNGIIHIPEVGSVWNGNGETLYIVFDNTEDSAYSKQLNANIKLTYTKHVSE